MQNENEVYLALVGGRMGRFWWGKGQWPREGQPAQVSFDHKKVMEQEERHGNIVGFFHTHPKFKATPSSTDYATMDGWTTCFGKPLACCIEGTDGLKAHWFFDDETEHETYKVWRFGDYFIGVYPDVE